MKISIKARDRLELLSMSNLGGKSTGITNVTVHLVPGGKYFMGHSNRVKVSNVKPGFSKTDNFSITVPGLKVIGKCKLTTKELKLAKRWVEQNSDILQKLWSTKSEEEYDIADFIKDMKKA